MTNDNWRPIDEPTEYEIILGSYEYWSGQGMFAPDQDEIDEWVAENGEPFDVLLASLKAELDLYGPSDREMTQ
jgi:hypothetical protein